MLARHQQHTVMLEGNIPTERLQSSIILCTFQAFPRVWCDKELEKLENPIIILLIQYCIYTIYILYSYYRYNVFILYMYYIHTIDKTLYPYY